MIAVIDIGSNSVRLMLWADGKTILKRILTTRLGAGIEERRLHPLSMKRSAEAVSRFYNEAKCAGAERIFAFATAAVRSAENQGEFLSLVREHTGLEVDVVSGEEEAGLAALGALGNHDGIVIDVGGASSEVVKVESGKTVFAKSHSVGAVTLFERSRDEAERAREYLANVFSALPALRGKVFAVGGTATSLAALLLGLEEYDAERVQNFYISREDLSVWTEKLFSLSTEERKRLAGMDANRADVIACGVCILSEIVLRLGSDGIYVSDRDNLEGYLYARGIV